MYRSSLGKTLNYIMGTGLLYFVLCSVEGCVKVTGVSRCCCFNVQV